MRQYETGFVLSSSLPEEEAQAFIRQMAEVVSLKNGRMIKQDVWGKKRLAYPIKRFNEGIYIFFLYEGPGDVSQELERRFKQTDTVIRFLTVLKNPRDNVRRKKKAAREAAASAERTAAAAPQAPGTQEEK